MNPRRFLALHLPYWPTDRLRRARPQGPGPLALWAQQGPRRLLVAVDAAAEQAGLYAGQALADAQALLPGALLLPAEPAADARALQALALWARRFSPLTAADPPEGLLLDITGCDHLWGGEPALLAAALARLEGLGIVVQGAVAGAAATAAALARCRTDNPVAVSGIEAQLVAPLPLGPALRLEAEPLAALARLGLRRVGDLARQPRGPLARRFGPELLARLDALAGRRPTMLQPLATPTALAASRELLEPLITRAGIDAALDLLLAELCERLHAAGQGARRVGLSAWRVDGAVQRVAVGTSQAMRDPAHLRRLFDAKLERLEPGLGFERLLLEAWSAEPMPARQAGLDGDRGDEALAQLLDRLGQRVAVRRLAPMPSHWPEHQLRALTPGEAMPAPPPGWASRPAPVLLLPRPRAMAVQAAPDGTPQALDGRPLARAEGPLRLAPEWWRAGPLPAARDYWRVEAADAQRLWLFRDRAGWWLHGHLG